MSCSITPSTPSNVKIDIMMSNEAMNHYKKDYYGMSTCKVGYDYSYLADLKFLLQYSECAQLVCSCYCNCTNEAIEERINTL
jgi:hypothetical protein